MSQENKSSFLIDGCQEMFQKTPVRRGRYQSSFIRPICFFSEAETQTIKQISLFTVERRDQPSPIVGASTRQFRRAKIRQENAHDSISLSNRSLKDNEVARIALCHISTAASRLGSRRNFLQQSPDTHLRNILTRDLNAARHAR